MKEYLNNSGCSIKQTKYPDERGIYGLYTDFNDYIIDRFAEENVSANTGYSFLLSESMNGKRLTLTDTNGKIGTENISGYSISELNI